MNVTVTFTLRTEAYNIFKKHYELMNPSDCKKKVTLDKQLEWAICSYALQCAQMMQENENDPNHRLEIRATKFLNILEEELESQ
jgi:hypothetical protein